MKQEGTNLGENGLKNISQNESDISIDIKIQAEVEKIWINYDLDRNGTLDFKEVCSYLKSRCPHMPDEALYGTFAKIDINND